MLHYTRLKWMVDQSHMVHSKLEIQLLAISPQLYVLVVYVWRAELAGAW